MILILVRRSLLSHFPYPILVPNAVAIFVILQKLGFAPLRRTHSVLAGTPELIRTDIPRDTQQSAIRGQVSTRFCASRHYLNSLFIMLPITSLRRMNERGTMLSSVSSTSPSPACWHSPRWQRQPSSSLPTSLHPIVFTWPLLIQAQMRLLLVWRLRIHLGFSRPRPNFHRPHRLSPHGPRPSNAFARRSNRAYARRRNQRSSRSQS